MRDMREKGKGMKGNEGGCRGGAHRFRFTSLSNIGNFSVNHWVSHAHSSLNTPPTPSREGS